jgi:hypothetical protein
MHLSEALTNAFYVLEEERVRPTLSYHCVAKEWPPDMAYEAMTMGQQGYTPGMASSSFLHRERQNRPRIVRENPLEFEFTSVNFNLLLAILNQLAAAQRPDFIAKVLKSMLKVAPVKDGVSLFPAWRNTTSSLALVAEFCIRNGYLSALLDETLEVKKPSVGVAVMLRE